MEVIKHPEYDSGKSAKRINDILSADYSNSPFLNHIPNRDHLKYNSGYKVDVTSLFIDIVGSSNLTNIHRNKVLAKIYDCFISESIAIMVANDLCREININGDCVWGVFDTSLHKDKINTVFNVAIQLKEMVDTLNNNFEKKGYSKIEVGIGLDCGGALMVKTGYYGSGLNDVIWMGDVVNTACHLANKAGRQGRSPILISENIYHKLSYDNKQFFPWPKNEDEYEGVTYYEYHQQPLSEVIASFDLLDRLLNQKI